MSNAAQRPPARAKKQAIRDHKIATAIANGHSRRKICSDLSVSHHTVSKVQHSAAPQIATIKANLAKRYDELADKSVTRALETVSQASFRDAVLGSGIATDKALLLRGESPPAQVINIAMLGVDPASVRIEGE